MFYNRTAKIALPNINLFASVLIPAPFAVTTANAELVVADPDPDDPDTVAAVRVAVPFDQEGVAPMVMEV